MSRLFGNKYKNLIASGSNQKSEFNNNPGVEFGIYRIKNPYTDLIKKWEFTKTSPSAPFIGRTKPPAPIIDIYYVTDGYVVDDYVEVQQSPAY